MLRKGIVERFRHYLSADFDYLEELVVSFVEFVSTLQYQHSLTQGGTKSRASSSLYRQH